MARKKKTRIQLDQSSGFGSSLGAQLGLSAPAVDESNESLQSHTVVKADEVCVYSIQLRISRKGYGGKTVTECRGLGGADEPTTVALTRSLAKRLGVRVFWKEGVFCVQGDQRERLATHFEAMGHQVRSNHQ